MGFISKPGISLALLMALSLDASADITNRFSGFATLGLVSNDNPDLVFRRDVTQKDGSADGEIDWRTDSILGLQWQTQWSYQFETSAQLVLKDRLENNLGEAVEWAFLRYRPLDSLDIRLGRLGADIFMISDYRQVGYALPWVRPPVETYGLLSLYYFDGIDATKRFDLADGTLSLKAFYGRSDRKYPVERGGSDYDYRFAFDAAGASISWERDAWKLRYSQAGVEVLNNNETPLNEPLAAVTPLWPEASQLLMRLQTKGKHIYYRQLSLAYDNNDWWVQSEISRLATNADVISDTHHFYLSAGYRFDKITLFGAAGVMRPGKALQTIRAPTGYPEPINQQLGALAYATQLGLNGARGEQHSFTLGARWDFASKMDLKFQVDRIKVDKNGNALWLKVNQAALARNETANVVSMSWDVLF